MKTGLSKTLAVLSTVAIAAGPVALATASATLLAADAAYAKNGNGNGNGGGNGNGNGNGRGNGNSASAKSSGGNGNGNGIGRGQGRNLLESLGLQKRRVVVVRERSNSAPVRTQTDAKSHAAPTSRGQVKQTYETVTVSASPVPAAKPGNSWKTRVDGEIVTHPSELGPWNSARRSPVAIANMAEKYRATGEANGAGGMIGALVVAYEDHEVATYDFQLALDDAIEGGLIDEATANRIIDGTFTEDALAEDLSMLEDKTGGALLILNEETGTYGCDDSGAGDCSLLEEGDLTMVSEDRQTLDQLQNDDAFTELNDAIDAYGAAEEELEAANGSVQPNKSDDPAVQEQMLVDVLDLLDLEAIDPTLYELPEEGSEEAMAPLIGDGTEEG